MDAIIVWLEENIGGVKNCLQVTTWRMRHLFNSRLNDMKEENPVNI